MSPLVLFGGLISGVFNLIPPFFLSWLVSTSLSDAINFISEHVGGTESVVWSDIAPLFLIEVYEDAPEPPPKNLLRTILLAHGNFQSILVKDKFLQIKCYWVGL